MSHATGDVCTSDDNVILTPSINSIKELTSKELKQLDGYYLEEIPEYTVLMTEYNKERKKSISSRRKSLFPSKEKWTPPARELTSYEQELLLGPSPTVTLLRRVQICDIRSRRWVTYSAAESEQSMRVSSSYVSTKHFTDGSPQFGRITRIFSHSFAKQHTIFVHLSLYSTPTLNTDVNMWSAPALASGSTTLLPVSDVSYPLVVAREDDTIWFLNYVV